MEGHEDSLLSRRRLRPRLRILTDESDREEREEEDDYDHIVLWS